MSTCSEDFCSCVSHFQCLDHAWLLEKDIGMAVGASFSHFSFFLTFVIFVSKCVVLLGMVVSSSFFVTFLTFITCLTYPNFLHFSIFISDMIFVCKCVVVRNNHHLSYDVFCSMILILNNAKVIKTENLRKFLARRRWQRCGQVWSKSITITFTITITTTIINVITDQIISITIVSRQPSSPSPSPTTSSSSSPGDPSNEPHVRVNEETWKQQQR